MKNREMNCFRIKKDKTNQFHAHWRPAFKVSVACFIENNKIKLIVEVMFYNEPKCQSPGTILFCCHGRCVVFFFFFFSNRLASEHQQVELVEHNTFF